MSQNVLGFREYTRRFASPLKVWYATGVCLLAIVNLVNLEIPQLAKQVINRLIDGKEIAGARGLALAIVGLGALMIAVRTLSRVVLFWPGRRIEADTKTHLFARVMRLPEAFFAAHGMGDLISRLANDVGQLRVFYAFGVLQILNTIFLLGFTTWKMATVHVGLTVAALVPLLAMFAVSRYAMPRMHVYSRESQKALGALTNRVTEAFVNVHVLQTNAATTSFAARTEDENEEVFRSNMRMVYLRTCIFPLMTCLAGFSQLVVLFYGGYEVMHARLTVGDILAFNVYIGLLAFPLTAMGMIMAAYERAKTSLERIGAIDRAEPEKAEVLQVAASAAVSQPVKASLLEVRNLSYAHTDKDGQTRLCLDGLNFQLQDGERLGLYGAVGSGKSTLLSLITRLLEPPAGTIFFRGRDVLTIDPRELRREIGLALQSVHLFSASVRENLAFGIEPQPPEEKLRQAAAEAEVLGEVESFPSGFATEIGEKGIRLSGGQKQRLALARLFLRRQPLLLLDDVLSAVDHQTERRLVDRIHARGAGLVVASHRGSVLKRCDVVLVLDDGRIADRGTWAELSGRIPAMAAEG